VEIDSVHDLAKRNYHQLAQDFGYLVA